MTDSYLTVYITHSLLKKHVTHVCIQTFIFSYEQEKDENLKRTIFQNK